mmetsp:Transcript_108199/g.241408  ORF Transcript_108199/g.241408 Transcript_108199/m.241408 type:complete len:81 (+) Transcript_108199:947-1189(+)
MRQHELDADTCKYVQDAEEQKKRIEQPAARAHHDPNQKSDFPESDKQSHGTAKPGQSRNLQNPQGAQLSFLIEDCVQENV